MNERFLENMKGLLEEDFVRYEKSLSLPAKRGFRQNVIYKKIEIPYEKEKIDGLENCFVLNDQRKLGNSIYHHLGAIYLQEPSSMIAANLLEVSEGEKILDLCSAPGGKGSQILEKNRTGVVVLNEVVKKRASILLSNIERQGFKNALITSYAPSELASRLPNYFHKILVDAPCSGEGMFRKDPLAIGEWNENLPSFNHKRQLEILAEADKMLKEGGIIVYSTCTFNEEENEKTVYEFKEKYGYEILPLPAKIKKHLRDGITYLGDEELKKTGRCFPQDDFGEGQFVAKLIKKSPNNYGNCRNRARNNFELSKNELKNAKMLTNECLKRENFKFYKLGNAIFIYENEFVPLENAISIGVKLADINKDRLVIAHQFFKAFGEEFINKVNLDKDDSKVKDFCFGNEIDCDAADGYVAVLVSGIPLGGGKCVKGRLKNYYPKGLRAKIF